MKLYFLHLPEVYASAVVRHGFSGCFGKVPGTEYLVFVGKPFCGVYGIPEGPDQFPAGHFKFSGIQAVEIGESADFFQTVLPVDFEDSLSFCSGFFFRELQEFFHAEEFFSGACRRDFFRFHAFEYSINGCISLFFLFFIDNIPVQGILLYKKEVYRV